MIYAFGPFKLDTASFELKKEGKVQKIEPKVFELLAFLIRNQDRVVSRDDIIDEIWDGRIVSEATVSTCLKEARQAIGDDGKRQALIRTVHGRGFRFVGQLLGEVETQVADTPPKTGSDKPVILILPFANMSAEDDAYFADGVTEDIITNLSRFRDLSVVARTTSFRFKGEGIDLAEACAQLGAAYAVEGSVRRAGKRIRITAQLIDAADGLHLWADSFDRDVEDIFAVQDEVTRAIAAALGVQVQGAALQRAMKKSPAELDAYDCVLRARRYTTLLDGESHAEARDLLERAVKLDPSSADAHALLGNIYLAEHRFDMNKRADAVERALEMAQRATELDPQNAYARCWLAIVHFFRFENEKFEAEAQRALNLNPSDPETLADVGHYLAFMGEFERGDALSHKARALNPLHPGWYFFSTARLHFHRKEYVETLAYMERIGLAGFYWTHLITAATQGHLGAKKEANMALETLFSLKPDFVAEEEIRKWNAAPDDAAHLLEGLKKAGLK